MGTEHASRPVVVAVDFSDVGKGVVAQAVELAQALHAPIYLVHVAEPEPDLVGYQAGPQHERDRHAREYREEHRELQALAERLRDLGLDATPILAQGPAAEKITHEAKKLSARLLVIGRHSRSSIGEIIAGSVAREILQNPPCAVVVVPA